MQQNESSAARGLQVHLPMELFDALDDDELLLDMGQQTATVRAPTPSTAPSAVMHAAPAARWKLL